MTDDTDDPVKVKQLLEWATRKSLGGTSEPAPAIDAATQAQLEAWFGVPSYEALEERGDKGAPPPALDPELEKVRERRDAAIAAIDPAMLASIHQRLERCDTMRRFEATIDLAAGLAVDPDFGLLDFAMIERVGSIADPRELEVSDELQDDLRDCTPQALLRDLHRAEIDFDKQFETTDVMMEHRIDVSGLVSEAMKTDWSPPPPSASLFAEGSELLREIVALRRMPWTDIPMPNRRVKE